MRKFFLLFGLLILTSMLFSQKIVFESATYEDVLAKAKSQNKPIMIDFSADWCVPCQVMESEVFTNPQLSRVINENFIALQVDVSQFTGMDIAEEYGVSIYPTIIFLHSDGNVANRQTGFCKTETLLNTAQRIVSENKVKNRF